MTKESRAQTEPSELDIVVPCYNEEEVLPDTTTALLELLDSMAADGLVTTSSRVVFVDDGSADATWDLIQSKASETKKVLGLKLARNVGHQNALLAGLANSSAELVLSIDADLQDDLNVIPEMIRKAVAGADVVCGVRSDRSSDSRFKRVTAEAYYKTLEILGVRVIQNHADFRLMRREAVNRLLQYKETNLYLRGIVPLVGHNTQIVAYSRKARMAGETKYPLRKMIGLAVDGITSFSAVPLRAIALLGFCVFLLSFAMTLWVLWVRFFAGTAIPGWASTLLPTVFLGGVQLLSLGVIGEYIAKIYLESKQRPKFFVERTTKP